MNGEIPNQTPKKGLLFEILLVVIVLVLVFGTLNYFNILKLSEIFPQLGFLSHKEVPTGTSQSNNAAISPTNQAKEALTNFIPTVIAPSFVPKSSSDIVFVKGKTAKDDFLAAWEIQDGKAGVRFVSSPDGNQIASLYILFDYNTSDPVSEKLAKEIIPQFFLLTPKEEFRCKTLSPESNYCESFWQESNGTKIGVGIQGNSPSSSDTKKVGVFFCQYNKDSKLYSWKSCTNEFAKTGVR